MVGNNSKEFSTNFIQRRKEVQRWGGGGGCGITGVQTKEKFGVGGGGGGGGRCRKGRKENGTTQCYQSYLLKGKVSPKGSRVCANCEGVSSGEGDGSAHFSCQVSKMSASHALKL